MKRCLLLLPFLAACGNAEIVVPEPLTVVDTHPGNGSVVPAGDQPIVIAFSEAVVSDLLEPSVSLEETTEQGTPIRELPLTLDSYDADTFTAVFSTETLPAGTTYALTVRREPLRAASGAKMSTDLTRRFQTR